MSLGAQQERKAVISGVVSDNATGTPLENVNVFLSFTTIGASTGLEGNFSLTNVPPGAYDLVVSRIGYEREVVNIRIVASETLHCDIRLKPHILQEEVVNIIAENPEEWKKNLKRFVKAFVGTTENAHQCQILNPEVLDFRFDDNTDTLLAATDSVLRIENRALGYRLFIMLRSFVWNLRLDCGHYLIYPRFVELEPHDVKELTGWQENRSKSFKGSLKHFLRALDAGTTDDEKFSISSGSLKNLRFYGHQVRPDEIVSDNSTPIKTILFPDYLRIEYLGRGFTRERITTSLMILKEGYALIDGRGNLLNPLSLEIYGSWSFDRIAKMLPLDIE
jgi:hypothetical protein